MTPAKVKLQVENAGSVLIPIGNYTPPATTATTTIVGAAWPVGSIFISTVSTNPATLLGVGTWTAFGAGRVLVGFNGADSDFNTAEGTGGAKTHTLTIAEMPAHTHPVQIMSGGSETANGGNSNSSQGTTGSTGGGGAHNNLQPYITVYMWKRTA
jgi:hypothetical protein